MRWNRAAMPAALLASLFLPAAAFAQERFSTDDLVRLADVSEPVFAPDGEQITYVVTAQGEGDVRQSDLWVTDWESGSAHALFPTMDADEYSPQYSPDGHVLAFLRADSQGDTQVWISRDGATPSKVSDLPGGVNEFSLAPDGRSAVVVSEVGEHVGEADGTAPPIVVTRFAFKADGRGWIDDRRQHLFRLDFAGETTRQVTTGDHDNTLPAWSPDGKWIAFVSKRCADADRHYCSDVYIMPAEGGEARRISRFDGGDADPEFESGGPKWSPDSGRLTWIRAGEEKLTWYTPFQIVVADITSGEELTPGWIDRWFFFPRWSADGRHVLALVEQDRTILLARIDPENGDIDYLTRGPRTAYDFAVGPKDRLAVLDGDDTNPIGLRSVENTQRSLSPQNAWVAQRKLAQTRSVSFMSGETQIHGLLTLPPDHKPGERHPLIVRLHGGPVYQYSHEFQSDWQVFAAHGYAVLGINPRGSSGRGAAFAQAQMANWGTVDVADISAGIDYAISLGVADPDAIGVGGWSYGGILTNYMIASDPRIKAGVSGAGMANFLAGYGADQYARDYELELGNPWTDKDRWLRLSYPFFQADTITAPTLYLCAGADWNVPCIGSEQMYLALRSNDVPSTLVIYPRESHGLSVPSYLRDRMDRQVDWYDRFLRGE